MQPPVKKPLAQRNVTLYVFIPLIIGLHIGWYSMQQRYVPANERHNHPLVTLYKKYIT